MHKTNIVKGTQTWREDGVLHVDVRGLHPPQPMVAVLSLLESENCPYRVIVHIDREPIYLFPELEDRGWAYAVTSIDTDYYQIQLSR